MYGSVEVSAAPVALAMFPEEAVRDGGGPTVAELEVKGLTASGSCHDPAS